LENKLFASVKEVKYRGLVDEAVITGLVQQLLCS